MREMIGHLRQIKGVRAPTYIPGGQKPEVPGTPHFIKPPRIELAFKRLTSKTIEAAARSEGLQVERREDDAGKKYLAISSPRNVRWEHGFRMHATPGLLKPTKIEVSGPNYEGEPLHPDAKAAIRQLLKRL